MGDRLNPLGLLGLFAMPALGEFLDHLGVEGGDVVGIAAGHQTLIHHHRLHQIPHYIVLYLHHRCLYLLHHFVLTYRRYHHLGRRLLHHQNRHSQHNYLRRHLRHNGRRHQLMLIMPTQKVLIRCHRVHLDFLKLQLVIVHRRHLNKV